MKLFVALTSMLVLFAGQAASQATAEAAGVPAPTFQSFTAARTAAHACDCASNHALLRCLTDHPQGCGVSAKGTAPVVHTQLDAATWQLMLAFALGICLIPELKHAVPCLQPQLQQQVSQQLLHQTIGTVWCLSLLVPTVPPGPASYSCCKWEHTSSSPGTGKRESKWHK